MNNFWDGFKAFFTNLGHTIMGEIITALPQAEQILMQAISALVDAAIAYVEAKYGAQTAPETLKALSPEDKMALDNQRHNDAFNYVREQIALNPSAYPVVPDSLLHCHVEIAVQKAKRTAEGNGGNGFQDQEKSL